METKTQKISRYISSSRAEMQLPVLEVRAHNAAVQEWLDRVRFVPVEHLDDCYQMAMDVHSTRSPLIAKEILDQWRIISARPGFRDKQTPQEKTCRYWCSGSGWILVDADGNPAPKDPRGKPEYVYAKPCPDHRPKGVMINGADPTAGGLPRVRRLETMFVSGRKEGGSVEGWGKLADIARKIITEPEPTDADNFFWDESD